MDADHVTRRLREALVEAPDVIVAASLYGSVARGTSRPGSDVDLAVLLADAPASTLEGRQLAYEATLAARTDLPVQLLVLNDASPDLVHRVLRDRRLLLDRDPRARVAFEVRARNEYFDGLPFLRRYRDAAVARRPMTDRDLVLKKLARIVTCVGELQRLARLDLLREDVREQRFVEHSLQIATQAALDVASHVVSDELLGEPETNRELFGLLARAGWLEVPLAERLSLMAGFRNVLVHGYDDVDLGVVEDIVRHRLGDLTAFADAVSRRLA